MIVTVLGGSAFSTPWLVDRLAERRVARAVTIRLAGRTRNRLSAVERACSLLAEGSSVGVERFEADQWQSALDGADMVLIQIRAGGLEARHFDETFPPRYGIPGDEGLGPGGLAAAVRTWPELREILELIHRHAPGSLPILLTSPGSLLIRAAARAFPKYPLYGICELPLTTLEGLCEICSFRLEGVSFSYAGTNHLGWLYNVKREACDLIEQYSCRTDLPLAEVAREYGALPLKYARLHFEQAVVVDEQQRAGADGSRSKALTAARERALLAFNNARVDAIRDALRVRSADWYTRAIGPLISELAGEAGCQPFFISMADQRGEVRERACALRDGRFVPIAMDQPPSLVESFVNEFMDYDRMAALAVLDPDQDRLTQALAAHPWVKTRRDARSLAGEIWNDFEQRGSLCGLGGRNSHV